MKQLVYRFATALALCLSSIPAAAGEASRVHVSADKALTAPADVKMASDTASLTFQLTPLPVGTILDVTPLFRWNAVFDAASYQLQVSTASDFSSLVVDQSGITETGRLVTPAHFRPPTTS